MTWRSFSVLLLLISLGCHSFPDAAAQKEQAQQLWQDGQTAHRAGQPERALGFYEKSLSADPTRTRNHLSLAAAYLDAGDGVNACIQLSRYIDTHPEHLEVRPYYADLLLKLERVGLARLELEHFIADAQEHGDKYQSELLHCHSRLMDLAEEEDDLYHSKLHRGIGLYLLARQWTQLVEGDEELTCEALLCKAAGELSIANLAAPHEARPCWYLHAVWAKLGQVQAARRWLCAAQAAAPGSDLTPSEQRTLLLASAASNDKKTIALPLPK